MMKKLLLCFAFLAVCGVVFSGCREGCITGNEVDYPLDGTVWEYSRDYNDGSTNAMTLRFQQTTFNLTGVYLESGVVVYTQESIGFYTYTPPKLVLEADEATMNCIVAGDKMVWSDAGDDIIFTKKISRSFSEAEVI